MTPKEASQWSWTGFDYWVYHLLSEKTESKLLNSLLNSIYSFLILMWRYPQKQGFSENKISRIKKPLLHTSYSLLNSSSSISVYTHIPWQNYAIRFVVKIKLIFIYSVYCELVSVYIYITRSLVKLNKTKETKRKT